jgi:hypothetical protein
VEHSTLTLHSDYSYSQHTMLSGHAGLFSFPQTEPQTEFLMSSWGTTVDGAQSLQDFHEAGSSHSGDHEDPIFTSGTSTPRGARLDPSQAVESWPSQRMTSVSQGGQSMSRMDSNRSSGSSLSRSSQLSHAHSTGNASAFRHGSQAAGSLPGMNPVLLDGTTGVSSQMYWGEYPLDMHHLGLADGTYPVADVNPMQVVSNGQISLGSDVNDSPLSWECFSNISRTSSPSTVDEAFSILPLSPHSSPEIACQSPR